MVGLSPAADAGLEEGWQAGEWATVAVGPPPVVPGGSWAADRPGPFGSRSETARASEPRPVRPSAAYQQPCANQAILGRRQFEPLRSCSPCWQAAWPRDSKHLMAQVVVMAECSSRKGPLGCP